MQVVYLVWLKFHTSVSNAERTAANRISRLCLEQFCHENGAKSAPSGRTNPYFRPLWSSAEFQPPEIHYPYAGVLAYLGVYCSGFEQPILFQHPRYTGTYPDELLLLERRWFDKNLHEVKKDRTGQTDLLVGMNFVVL